MYWPHSHHFRSLLLFLYVFVCTCVHRLAREMSNHLHFVSLLYCIEKCYILHIYCSTEVSKIVSGAQYVQCDDLSASNLQDKCVFVTTMQHVAQLDA